MPYDKPPDKIKGLPKHAKEIWMAAFNSAWDEYEGDEAKANATAWAAVKKAGYYQDSQGKWHKGEEPARVVGCDLSAFVALDSRGDVWNDLPGWSPQSSTPPEWIRVLPFGKVVLNDDRQPFTVTNECIKKVMDKFARNNVDMVIDYEHQTMTEGRAPAAGWVKELRKRDDGLWAYVQWTDAAKDYIRTKEYRYYSPTVRLDSQRHVQELLHIGLTNFPAISGIPPLTLKKNNSNSGGKDEVLEKLINVLGLEGDASEVDALMMVSDLLDVKKICDGHADKIRESASRIEKLSSDLTEAELRAVTAENNLNKLTVPITIVESLGVKKDASLADIVNRIEGLKMAAERAADLDKELASFKGGMVKSAAEQMIEEALKTGRTSPSELEKSDGKLKKLAESDPEFFKDFVLIREPGSVVPLDRLPRTPDAPGQNRQDVPAIVQKLIDSGSLTLDQYKAQLELEKSGRPFAGFSANR